MTKREQFLADILILAREEGGIRYWVGEARTRDNVFEVREESSDLWHKITHATIERGIAALTENVEIKLNPDLRKDIWFASLTSTADQLDGEAADCIVQAGLFNDIVYG